MRKDYDLPAIVSQLSEEELAGMPPDDAMILITALRQQPRNPPTAAAIERLAASVLRNSSRQYLHHDRHH